MGLPNPPSGVPPREDKGALGGCVISMHTSGEVGAWAMLMDRPGRCEVTPTPWIKIAYEKDIQKSNQRKTRNVVFYGAGLRKPSTRFLGADKRALGHRCPMTAVPY